MDKKNTLWVGTWAAGFNKFNRDDSTFTRYRFDPDNPNSLNDDRVMVITGTGDDLLWLGTSAGGLNRFNKNSETFTHYTKRDGLPSNNIYGLAEDGSGNLWISTDRGLALMDIEAETFRTYDERDGLPSSEFNERSYYKSRDGHLFFGSRDKLIAFHPDSLKDNTYIPPLVLTDFRIFNRSAKLDTAISRKNHIILSYDQNFLSFEFAALNYEASEKNQYRYKMAGTDKDWINAGTRRLASYTNLAPGDYVFTVQGSNNDDVWNETGASIRLTILPPWWRTQWAYGAYVLLFLAALYGWRRFELRRVYLKNELKVQRLEADKLRELDEMRTRFFANISHEFRTPLSLIRAPIEKLRERYSDEASQRDLSVMRQNVNRLLRLINQLLDLSRLEAGGLELQTRATEVAPFLRARVMAFSSLAQLKGLSLQFIAPEQNISTYLDREKVEKVITNLLSNAIKFTPAGGEVLVAVGSGSSSRQLLVSSGQSSVGSERLISGQRMPDDCLLITVKDTGIGIPAERQDKIFDRFYQVDDSQTRAHEGTGIGLALTKELVALHGGKIEVESEPHKGAAFHVYLPLGKDHLQPHQIIEEDEEHTLSPAGDATELSAASAEVEPTDGHDATSSESRVDKTDQPIVLVVEDNADVRRYLREALDGAYQIVEASDGAEGLQTALDVIPDLIVSDVMMPNMDGFEMCRRIKSDEKTSHVPVILLTARASRDSKLEGLKLGADAYVAKPFDTREVVVRVRSLIEQRRQLAARFRREITLQPNDVAVTSMDEQFLQRLLEVIEVRLSDPDFDVRAFSRAVGMSRQHLNRKLKGLAGQSASDFIRTMRLKRAAQLLGKRSATITEIAYEVGFSNPAHFSKSFRETFGKTPSEYLACLE